MCECARVSMCVCVCVWIRRGELVSECTKVMIRKPFSFHVHYTKQR